MPPGAQANQRIDLSGSHGPSVTGALTNLNRSSGTPNKWFFCPAGAPNRCTATRMHTIIPLEVERQLLVRTTKIRTPYLSIKISIFVTPEMSDNSGLRTFYLPCVTLAIQLAGSVGCSVVPRPVGRMRTRGPSTLVSRDNACFP